jgi:hypothetical protein
MASKGENGKIGFHANPFTYQLINETFSGTTNNQRNYRLHILNLAILLMMI